MVLYAKDRSLMASILIHLFCFGIFSVLSYQGVMTHVKGKGPIYMVGLSGGKKGGAPPAAAPFRTKNLPPLPARSDDMVTEKSTALPSAKILQPSISKDASASFDVSNDRAESGEGSEKGSGAGTGMGEGTGDGACEAGGSGSGGPSFRKRPQLSRGHAQPRHRRTRHCPDGGRKRWRCRSGIGHPKFRLWRYG